MSIWSRFFGRSSTALALPAPQTPHVAAPVDDFDFSKAAGASPNTVLGVPGTPVFSGFAFTAEMNDALIGLRKWTTYANNLANTPSVAAAVRYVLNLVCMPNWRWEAPDDSGSKGEEIADQVDDILNDMKSPWRRVVRRMAMYRYDGCGWHEWTAKRREDGGIGLLDVAARRPHTLYRWLMDDQGYVEAAVQKSPQTGAEITIPRWKAVYLKDDSISDSPEGVGLFRHVVDACNARARFAQLERMGFETDLRGIPYIRAPLLELAKMVAKSEITDAQKDAILAPLRTIMDSHVRGESTSVMVDSSTYPNIQGDPTAQPRMSFELMRGESAPHEAIAAAISRLDHEIMRILGAEVLMVGGDGKGSYSLAKDKTQSLMVVVDGTLQEIGEAVRKDLIEPLGRLNGWPLELLPWPKIDPLRFRDVEQVTAALRDLATAGAPLDPQDPAADEVRDMLGLSRRDPLLLEETDEDSALVPPPDDPDAEDAERDDEPPPKKRRRRK
jgi:hypothetical protein